VYLGVQRGRAGTGEGAAEFRVERLRDRRLAPDIAIERPDRRAARLAELGGRVVLVHFWATWCPPCVDELPGLLETAREHPGVELVAVSLDDDWATIRDFFDGAIPAEIALAADRDRTNELYDLVSLPDTYLASDGRLVFRYGGARDWRSDAARRHLSRTLAEIAARPRPGR
jgi:thiol-disulfide isomerase/thioredoxin